MPATGWTIRLTERVRIVLQCLFWLNLLVVAAAVIVGARSIQVAAVSVALPIWPWFWHERLYLELRERETASVMTIDSRLVVVILLEILVLINLCVTGVQTMLVAVR